MDPLLFEKSALGSQEASEQGVLFYELNFDKILLTGRWKMLIRFVFPVPRSSLRIALSDPQDFPVCKICKRGRG